MKAIYKRILIILSAVLIVLHGFSGAARGYAELLQDIAVAEKKFKQASENLANKNRKLFNFFANHPFELIEVFAKKRIKELYPKEYSEYKQAKVELDNLLDVKQISEINGLSEQ